MRPVFHTTIVLLALVLSACEMKTPRAKTPPPPQPDTRQSGTRAGVRACRAAFHSTDTGAACRSPQPIDPEALATPPVYVPAEQSADSKTRRG